MNSGIKVKLGEIGIPMKETHANFILLYLPDEENTVGIAERLKANRILIKSPFNLGAQKGWVRATVGSLDDSKRLIKVITNFLLESSNA